MMEKVEFAREWIDMIMDVCLIFLYRESIFLRVHQSVSYFYRR